MMSEILSVTRSSCQIEYELWVRSTLIKAFEAKIPFRTVNTKYSTRVLVVI